MLTECLCATVKNPNCCHFDASVDAILGLAVWQRRVVMETRSDDRPRKDLRRRGGVAVRSLSLRFRSKQLRERRGGRNAQS